jgi:16S rRNA (uracil1498-N3)-methyltransferase
MSIYYFCARIEGEKAIFDAHETGHIRVMRKTDGDRICFTDGRGMIYDGEIIKIKKNETIVEIAEQKSDVSREIAKNITLTSGISKWNRLSLLLEKSVELGVKQINLVKCEHSNFPKINTEKVNKTLRKALKQCGGTVLPEVTTFDSFEQLSFKDQTAVLLNPYTQNSISECAFPNSVNLFIGPEGGFTDKELEIIRDSSESCMEVSMGNRILRLETAAIVAISFIALQKQNDSEDQS